MNRWHWKRAVTKGEISAAQAVSAHVIHQELHIPTRGHPACASDCREAVEHVLVLDGNRCVGTARLTRPDPQAARAQGTELGLEIEAELSLTSLERIRWQLIEVSRVCVLKSWHGTLAVQRLYEAMVVQAWLMGGRYLLGGVDCQTGNRSDADLMFEAVEHRGWLHPHYRVSNSAHPTEQVPEVSPFFYDEEARRRAAHGDLSGLRVAPAIAAFAKRLGARAIGRPVPHAAFPRYVTPMLASLEELPSATLGSFDPALLALTLSTTSPSHDFIQPPRRIAS